jgi:hypothetical protein
MWAGGMRTIDHPGANPYDIFFMKKNVVLVPGSEKCSLTRPF